MAYSHPHNPGDSYVTLLCSNNVKTPNLATSFQIPTRELFLWVGWGQVAPTVICLGQGPCDMI